MGAATKVKPEFDGLEAWVSTIEGRIVLKTRDSQGLMVDTILGGGKTVHLSPNDRRINQDLVGGTEQDPFQNGFLAPVRLLDCDRDTAKLAANPNVMTEADMVALFDRSLEGFVARLGEITLPTTLQRMLRMVGDVPDATVRQQRAIEDRITALAPATHTEVVSADSGGRPTVGRAVQPH